MIVMALLIVYGGRHIDLFGQWLWDLFGAEWGAPPGSADWHARVALGLAMPILILEPINFYWIFRKRRYLKTAASQAAEQAALRLEERAERDRKLGKSASVIAAPTQPEREGMMQRWPLLHDVVWGWPLLLALPMTLFGEPLDAMRGLMLGVPVYMMSHAISKTGLALGVKLGIAWSAGAAAVGLWLHFAI